MIIFYRLVGKSNLFRFSIKGLYSIKGSHAGGHLMRLYRGLYSIKGQHTSCIYKGAIYLWGTEHPYKGATYIRYL